MAYGATLLPPKKLKKHIWIRLDQIWHPKITLDPGRRGHSTKHTSGPPLHFAELQNSVERRLLRLIHNLQTQHMPFDSICASTSSHSVSKARHHYFGSLCSTQLQFPDLAFESGSIQCIISGYSRITLLHRRISCRG